MDDISLSETIGTTDTATTKGGRVLQQAANESGFAFDRFVFYPLRQALFDGSKEVRLGGRAAAVLTTLVERPHEVVTKEEILQAAWPSTHVDEGNLRVQIVALRKILGDSSEMPRFISSVAGRGYIFVSHVEQHGKSFAKIAPEAASLLKSLPTPISKLIGRSDAVLEITRRIEDQRLVTVVGPGGIGKTTIALSAARQLSIPFEHGMVFVDLASISEESQVPFAVAAAFNISAATEDPIASLVTHLRYRKIFILLDNCEHVIESAALLAEALLRGAPDLRVLATSHEPLRAEGEWLFRLAPLTSPPNSEDMTLEDARRYPSIELFVERATSDNQALMLSDEDVPYIVEICRKLDGIPLAIEIAAARVEVFGIEGLASRLDHRLDVPNTGRRTAVQRHQTMRNMLDWTHDNLSSSERTLLRRLGVFSGSFSLEAATMIGGDERLTSFAITEALSSLVRKSLLHPNFTTRSVTYRLLESTRLYALERLQEAGEMDRMRRLHTQFAIDILQRAEDDWTVLRRSPWIERYAWILDDVRQALAWAFSATGDAAAGVRLTALSIPLGMQIGLIDEFRERNDIAMARARELPVPELVAEMRLNIFTAFLNTNQSQPLDHTMSGVERAVYLAEQTGEDLYRLQPLFQQAGFNMGMGNYRVALDHAEKLSQLSERVGNDYAVLGSKRMLAQTSHFSGLHSRTIELSKAVLASPVVNIPIAFGSIQVDRRVSMRIVQARSLWLRGKPDQAVDVMTEALRIAPEDGPHALCHALSQAACPILIWRGEFDKARDLAKILLENSARFTLRHWHSWGRMYETILAGILDPGEQIGSIVTEGNLQIHTLATITGQLTAIDLDDSSFAENTGWAAPEILRRRGLEALPTDGEAAETLFMQAIEIAREQEALAWELRAITSLATIHRDNGKAKQAADRLSSILARFDEGLATKDLRAAADLLESL